MKKLLSLACIALCAGAATAQEKNQVGLNDLVVGSGEVVVYDTSQGPLLVNELTIESGGVLRVQGPNPFTLFVTGTMHLEGTLDLSGFAAKDVATLNTGHQPEQGAAGGPGGGQGGIASVLTTASTPVGGRGFGASMEANAGGFGGEAGYADAALGKDARRPGGGGGGALAADQPAVPGDPSHPDNAGLVSERGGEGSALSTGAVTGFSPAQGGGVGGHAFTDADPTNDFWGWRRDPLTGRLQRGELSQPVAGRGGGAGGDAVPGIVFPQPNWTPSSDEKGAGGGGGGGLGRMLARTLHIGPGGRILANGGNGAAGENTLFLDSIGGNSGGGSGGYLVIHALLVDLTEADDQCITALGGAGGLNASASPPNRDLSRGGNGGPGVIQLHTPRGMRVLLPEGKEIGHMTSPEAHLLLPILHLHR